MSISDLFGQVKTSVAASVKAEADKRRDAANRYDPIGEPFEVTPGGTFDLGHTVDDTSLHAAGGYPPDVPDNRVLDALGDIVANAKMLRQTRLISQRFTFANGDLNKPIVVTPSGIDSDSIETVTLIASAANAIRIGRDESNAAVGGFLPATTALMISPGTAVYATCSVAATTLDVFVVYHDRPLGTTPPN